MSEERSPARTRSPVMQASSRDRHPAIGATLRALAAALTCALGITVVTAAASAPHRESSHSPTSIVAKTAEVAQVAPRAPEIDGVLADAPITHAPAGTTSAGDPTSTATSRTAVTCSARGPPAQAVA